MTPASIDPLVLPSVALSDRRCLPSSPSIYFAIDSAGTIQYIGKTANLHERWKCHHRCKQLAALGGVRIAWMICDAELLSEVEAAMIAWFKPAMNAQPVLGNFLEAVNFKLPPKEFEILKFFCEQEQRSQTDVLREFIRSLEAKLEKN